MKKHIVITKLFEFGGSNTHLESLIRYLGKENITLLIEDKTQLPYLKNIKGAENVAIIFKPHLHKYAHLCYSSVFPKIKELVLIIVSIFWVMSISIKHKFAHITICVVEPEKYLYLFWIPFIRVTYILHSVPANKYTQFTSYTCNTRLSTKKKIITVSNANKQLIQKKWDVKPTREDFIYVIYNCLYKGPNTYKPIKKNNMQNVVTLGHLIEYKNPFLWFKVAKCITEKCNNVNFIWLGNGPLFDELEKAARPYKHINFKGYKTDVDEYLKNAAVYYQPSLFETLCIAVIEAMAYHKSAVVSNIGGLPEVVKANYNGVLVNPTDADAHVSAIMHLLGNKTLNKRYGENGYKRYLELFTYSSFKINMDVLYK